jgi:hypothetical protein
MLNGATAKPAAADEVRARKERLFIMTTCLEKIVGRVRGRNGAAEPTRCRLFHGDE